MKLQEQQIKEILETINIINKAKIKIKNILMSLGYKDISITKRYPIEIEILAFNGLSKIEAGLRKVLRDIKNIK